MDKKILKDVIYYLSDEQGFVASVIEKDFHLTRILNRVNEHLSTDIVFKGGTLLNKVYLNYHRLSEDLDFAYRGDADLSTRGKRSKAITPIREKMPAFLDILGLIFLLKALNSSSKPLVKSQEILTFLFSGVLESGTPTIYTV